MGLTRVFRQGFVGGEVSPELLGRVADSRLLGVTRMRNMVTKPTGVAVRRPRFEFVHQSARLAAKKSALLRWERSVDDSMVIEATEGAFRFHTDGGTQVYADVRRVASIDTDTERLTFTKPHGFASNDPVRVIVSSGATAPAGLSDLTTYYVRLINSLVIELSASAGPGAAVNITSSGTGTITVLDAAEVPAEYVASATISGVDFGAANEFTTSVAHAFNTGDPVNLDSTTDDLPLDLAEGATYYLIKTAANKFKLALTHAIAMAGTPVYNITDAGSGTQSVHYAYSQGDLVHSTGLGIFYVIADLPSGDPTKFYLEPYAGEYEVPNNFIETNLLYLRSNQKGSDLTISHADHDLGVLRRIDVDTWVWLQNTTFGATIDTPTIFSVTRTFGEYWNVTCPNASATFSTSGARHTLSPGDGVYLEAAIGAGTAPNGYSAGVKIINAIAPVPDLDFTLRSVDGSTLSNASGLLCTAVVRRISISVNPDEVYVVTALASDGEETVASSPVTASNNPLYVSGSYNTILVFPAVEGAARYRYYKKQEGIFGLIGESESTTFRDTNIAPDLSITPPYQDDSFATENPNTIGRFEQRAVFSKEDSQHIWFTRTNTDTTLTYHLPVIDTDRISFELTAIENCAIQHTVPLSNLIILTNSTEFVVTPVNSDAITPSSFRARPVTYVGSSHVPPVTTDKSILFAAARGGHIHEFRADGSTYAAPDISIRATHLFDDFEILDSAFMRAPFPVAWWVSSSGYLLGLTYVPDEEINGWHWHDTAGTFESCCVVSEGEEDRLYVVVLRNNGDGPVRTIERMAPFSTVTAASLSLASHLDSSVHSGGSLVTYGLDHLEGTEVTLAYNNGTVATEEISNGILTSAPAVLIGLPYTSELRTLPVAFQIDGAFGQGRTKNINRCWVRVANTCRFQIGPLDPEEDENDWRPATVNDLEVGVRADGEIDVNLPPGWTGSGQIWIRQRGPQPLTVVSLCAEVSIGD